MSPPISSQIQIKVSGNSAVYVVFIIASVVLTILGTRFQNVILMYLITGIGLVSFIALVVIGVIIFFKQSDAFLVKEEKKVVVEHRYYKTIGGEVKEITSESIPTTKLLDGKKESQ